MPSLDQRRRGRRGVGWALSVATALSLVGLAAPSHATGDDYPYAGLGKCPLVPLKHVKTDGPGKPGKPGKPGHQKPGHKPGKPAGTTPTKPPPPRQCAKHIWFYNGSYGDPWGFALRNCTSFVAWRLRMTNGMADFENHFGAVHWGNAEHWDEAARELGYLVDRVPAVGAVAQTDAGRVGHVAWVSAVGEGTVTVEEYNYGVAGGYDVRTVPTSDFRYLHLDDLSAAPYLGSTRAVVAATDPHGDTWTARTTGAGSLVVHGPAGKVTRLGHGWSPLAAPSVTADLQGRIWVAGVARDGRVLVTHSESVSTGSAARLGPLRHVARGSAVTSSPVVVADLDGGVRLFTVSATGSLLERHTLGRQADRWSRPHRLGLPGSWSTQAAPAAATGANGHLWLAAVTKRGSLLAQHTVGHAPRRSGHWSGFRRVDDRTWSTTSTPALAAGDDGRVWLATVDARGGLTVRHTGAAPGRWPAGTSLVGPWSPYASPALALDDTGRAWLAALGHDGRVVVRSAALGSQTWRPASGLARVPASLTASPTLVTTTDNGVLVGVSDRGAAVLRRPLGQARLLPVAHGPHGGGFSVSPFL